MGHLTPPSGVVGGVNINLFGYGETPGFVDLYTHNPDHLYRGSRRYSTAVVDDNTADLIFMRNSPVSFKSAQEIVRMGKPGTLVAIVTNTTWAGDSEVLQDPQFFSDHTLGLKGAPGIKQVMTMPTSAIGNRAKLVVEKEFAYGSDDGISTTVLIFEIE